MKRIVTVYWKDGSKEDMFHTNKEDNDFVSNNILEEKPYQFIKDTGERTYITHDDGIENIPLHAIKRIKVRKGR